MQQRGQVGFLAFVGDIFGHHVDLGVLRLLILFETGVERPFGIAGLHVQDADLIFCVYRTALCRRREDGRRHDLLHQYPFQNSAQPDLPPDRDSAVFDVRPSRMVQENFPGRQLSGKVDAQEDFGANGTGLPVDRSGLDHVADDT